jgi:hypothetical protein
VQPAVQVAAPVEVKKEVQVQPTVRAEQKAPVAVKSVPVQHIKAEEQEEAMGMEVADLDIPTFLRQEKQ